MKLSRNLILSILIPIIFLFSSCSNSPDTYVYLGKQVPKSYIKEIKKLGLLQNDEKIKYFYSDGFFDIKEGLYFVTDERLVAYSKDWEYPEAIIMFDEIIKLDVEYNDSWAEDSYIFVKTEEWELDFPVSNEKERDEDFFNYLFEKSDLPNTKD